MELSVLHLLTLKPRQSAGDAPIRFQNFFINEDIEYNGNTYGFLPFGFSGVTVNRSGDNQSTQLALPNNELSKSWALYITENTWVVLIDMFVWSPDDANWSDRLLSQYAGQATGALWNETELRIEISSVLDAVGSDVPRRRITEDIFGPLPTTANVRLS